MFCMDFFLHPIPFIAAGLDIACVAAVIFLERKNPASTLAWILVLLFLPFAGFVLYMAFGSGFPVYKKKRFIAKAARDTLFDRYLAKCLDIPPMAERRKSIPPSPTMRLVNYLDREGDGIYTPMNDAEIFYDGTDMFARMKEDMRRAEKHIHLLYYIFRNDGLGREILAILEQKAREGVEVRLMYDGLGSLRWFSRMFEPLKKAGGVVRPFSPVLFDFSPHIRLNYRNHRKLTVVDGQIGYIGGMNVGDEYLGRSPKLSPWRDTHLRLTGPSVWFLQERFFMDWLHANKLAPDPAELVKYFPPPLVNPDKTGLGVQIVSSGPDTQEQAPIKSGIMAMIYDAVNEVLIQTPYFTPDDSFLDALRIAAGSNVDVKLMLPDRSDNPLAHHANFAFARQVAEYGVKVYLYQGFIHAKTVTCDRAAVSIGSSNMDIRSFSLNFEVNAFIHNADLAKEHARRFEADLENCTAATPEWLYARGLWARGVSQVARLFAPLI